MTNIEISLKSFLISDSSNSFNSFNIILYYFLNNLELSNISDILDILECLCKDLVSTIDFNVSVSKLFLYSSFLTLQSFLYVFSSIFLDLYYFSTITMALVLTVYSKGLRPLNKRLAEIINGFKTLKIHYLLRQGANKDTSVFDILEKEQILSLEAKLVSCS